MVAGNPSFGGMAQDPYAPTASFDNGWASTSTTTSTASYTIYSNAFYSTDPSPLPKDIQKFLERLFDKGKFFQFESSMEFRAWFKPPRIPKKRFKTRHGFQQMCRLPNYRGVRTR